MKTKLWLSLLALLSFFTILLFGQISTPVPVDFSYTKIFQIQRHQGNPIRSITVRGNPDTLKLYWGGLLVTKEITRSNNVVWVSVGVGTNSSTYYTYVDTITDYADFWFPVGAPQVPDSLFYAVFDSLHSGDHVTLGIYTVNEVAIQPTARARPKDVVLTTTPKDTLYGLADTTNLGSPFSPQGRPIVSVFIKAKGKNANDKAIFALGYRLKSNIYRMWYGPLDSLARGIFPFRDSLYISAVDTVGLAILSDLTIGNADSMSLVIWGIAPLDTVVVGPATVHIRDN